MPVRERDWAKSAAEAPAAERGWVQRLNEFGERHARLIISLSTGLIILTVLVFAKHFYDRAQMERAEQELSQAGANVDKLKELKKKFGTTPAGPRISLKLANAYYEDNRLAEARAEYDDFVRRHAKDPLYSLAQEAILSLERNMKYEAEQKEHRLREYRLQTHPRLLPEARDPRLQWEPLPQPRPVAELSLAHGPVRVELYEDEAPNAVAAFVKLVEARAFDGVKVDKTGEERLEIAAKAEAAPDWTLAFEPTAVETKAGALVLVRKEGAAENLPGRFRILLKDEPDLRDVTVFGRVTDSLLGVQAAKKDDALKELKIVSKRDRAYEPEALRKK